MAKVEVALRDKLLLSYAEAAGVLCMSEPTLREIVKVKEPKQLINRIQIKTNTRFYIKDLHEFCREMRNKGVDPSASAGEIIRNLT